jgi:hypothetical protein
LSLASCWVFLVGNAQVHQGFFTWTPFKSSKCNALWLICMYSYLRNTIPFLLWTFFFKVLILVAGFHGFFAFTYQGHNLWYRPLRRDDLRWYRHTSLSKNLCLKDLHLFLAMKENGIYRLKRCLRDLKTNDH